MQENKTTKGGDRTENQALPYLIANARSWKKPVRTAKRYNGAVERCPAIYQINIGGELHGWFNTRQEARAAIAQEAR